MVLLWSFVGMCRGGGKFEMLKVEVGLGDALPSGFSSHVVFFTVGPPFLQFLCFFF